MQPPWHALTQLLADSDDTGDGDASFALGAAAREAWTETAARLGLVRLGWRPVGPHAEFDLAYPCERALVKSEARDAWLDGSGGGRGGGSARWDSARRDGALEEQTRIETADGVLVAAARAGAVPPAGRLLEVATLAAGLQRRRELRSELQRERRRARQGAGAAAAAHDVRNDLTRALLHAARGDDGDGGEVVEALRSARDLAQTALEANAGVGAAPRPQPVALRALLVEEARAASASVRVPAPSLPRLRVRCAEDLVALAQPDALGRALRNLVTNALEAAADPRVGAGRVEVSATRIEASHAGFDLAVRVRDDGLGMPARALARFLDGSASADASGSAEGIAAGSSLASTGLGTTSLRLALAALGAPLRVTSAPGQGTRVELRLRSQPRVAPVLVVDPDLRRGLRRMGELGACGETAWVLVRPEAVGALASGDAVRRVECVTALGDPRRRAELVRLCERRRLPLVWRSVGGGARASGAAPPTQSLR